MRKSWTCVAASALDVNDTPGTEMNWRIFQNVGNEIACKKSHGRMGSLGLIYNTKESH